MSTTTPSAIDQALTKNADFAKAFEDTGLTAPPRRKLAIITCMDARLQIEEILGLESGDAHILRNAGGSITEDMLRSAIVSTNVLGTREIMVINHTYCGMMSCTDQDIHDKLTEEYGPSDESPGEFHTFSDLTDHIREQVAKLRGHAWLPSDTSVRGFTYDVKTGLVHEVDCD